MNVLILNARSDVGGASLNAFLIVQEIGTRNAEQIRIVVACPNQEPFFSRYREMAQNGKIDLYDLNLRRIRFSHITTLVNIVRKHSINVIVSHGKGAGLWSRTLRLLFWNVKVMHQFHGIHLPGQWPLRVTYLFYERLCRFLTDRHISVSESEADLALRLGISDNNRLVIIHNGVDCDQYMPVSADIRKAARARIFRDHGDAPMILTVARLSYVKNIAFSLRIVMEYLNRWGKLRFVVVGGEDDVTFVELRNFAQRLGISDAVTFEGEQSNVLVYYQAADVYLGTSRWEGLPTAFLEAQACGVPVLATDVVGNRSAVLHGQTGFLIPAEAAVPFAERLHQLVTDSDLYKQMSAKAADWIRRSFSLQSMLDHHLKIILEFSNEGMAK